MTSTLPTSANANGDVLRALETDTAFTVHSLAEAVGRDAKNFARTIGRLEEDQLVGRGEGGQLKITEGGHRVRRALDLAEGLIDMPENVAMLPWSTLEPHPDNPRKIFGEAELASLADSIFDAGRLLQGLEVTLPAEGGKRHILIGERRWRAVGLLVADGRWDAGALLPCTVTPDRPGLIEERSLIENGQRVDLSELERAYAFRSLGLKRNWQPSQIARATKEHIRTVQQSLQVLREADPELLARHQADPAELTWEKLRESVQKPRPKASIDVTPKMALALVETAHAARPYPASRSAPISKPEPGGVWAELRDRGFLAPKFLGSLMFASYSPEVAIWLGEIGFDADPEAALLKARTEVVGALQASAVEPGEYLTEWLDVPPAPAVPATASEPEKPAEIETPQDELYADAVALVITDRKPSTSYIQRKLQLGYNRAAALVERMQAEGIVSAPDHAGRREVLAPPPAGSTPAPDDEAATDAEPQPAPAPSPAPAVAQPATDTGLKPHLALIMVEVAHKLERMPETLADRGIVGVTAAPTYNAHSPTYSLIQEKLLGIMPGRNNGWIAYFTDRGRAWLDEAGYRLNGEILISGSQLMNARVAADTAWQVEGYSTPWLNAAVAPPQESAAASPAPPPANAVRPPAYEDEETAEARLVLEQVLDTSTAEPQVLRTLLMAAGLELPLTVEGVSILDASRSARIDCAPDLDIPDALGEARARLLAMAVNAACGVEAE